MHHLLIIGKITKGNKELLATLELLDYNVIGIANSLKKTEELVSDINISLALIVKTDFCEIDYNKIALFLNEKHIPFLVLANQKNLFNITALQKAVPYGLINYPCNSEILKSNIEIAIERSRIEKKLHEKEKKYRIVFQSSNDAILLLSGDVIIECNNKATEIFAASPKEIVGKSFLDFCPEYQPYKVKSAEKFAHLQTLARNQVHQTQWNCINKHKLPLRMELTITYLNIEGQNYTQLILRDITERWKAEEKLFNSEARYRELFNNLTSGAAIYQPNTDGTDFYIIGFNKAAEKITRYSAEEVVGKSIFNVIKKVEKSPFLIALKEVYITGLSQTIKEYYYEDERYKGWQSSYLFKLPSGEIVSVFNDITQQKLATKKLEDSEQRYRTLIEMSPFGIIIYANGVIIFANPAAMKMLGVSDFALLNGKPFLEIISSKSKEMVMQFMSEVATHNKETPIVEYTFRRLDGETFEADVVSIPIEYNGLPAVQVVMTDITERKEMEEKLIANEEKYRRLFNGANDIILVNHFIKGKFGYFVEVNDMACKKLGYKRSDFQRLLIYDLLPDVKIQEIETLLNTHEKEKQILLESQILCRNGEFLPVEINAMIFEIDEDKMVFSIIRDISERKQIEKRLLTAVIETEEKERRRFAVDLHDGLGPLLSSIKIYINLLKSKKMAALEKAKMYNYVNELIDEAVRSTKTIANNLMPDILHDYGLISALKSFITKINSSNVLKIEFKHSNSIQGLEKNIEVTLYRIIMELINNTIKHANAKKVSISLNQNHKIIDISYTDDGIGMKDGFRIDNESAMGLKSIVNRLRSINGEIVFLQRKRGFGVKITIVTN